MAEKGGRQGGRSRLVDAALGDGAEREAEPAVDGVVEHLGERDVERDERGDDAKRAAGLLERDLVREDKVCCRSAKSDLVQSSKRECPKEWTYMIPGARR